MQTKKEKAVKHDEELAKLEAELVAQESPVEQEPVEQIAEETAQEESAPAEEQTAKVEEQPIAEEATDVIAEELTEEEKNRLSEKTRREMSRLREEARRSRELEAEIEALKKGKESKKPLEEAVEEYANQETPEQTGLPWEASNLTPYEIKQLARQEIERENRLNLISVDTEYLENAHPELNPQNPDYDPELASDIYSTFKAMFLKDETTRLREIAERKIALIEKVKARIKAQQEEEKAIAKQEAEQAPPVSVAKPKTTATVLDMVSNAKSLKELEALEAKIGKANR